MVYIAKSYIIIWEIFKSRYTDKNVYVWALLVWNLDFQEAYYSVTDLIFRYFNGFITKYLIFKDHQGLPALLNLCHFLNSRRNYVIGIIKTELIKNLAYLQNSISGFEYLWYYENIYPVNKKRSSLSIRSPNCPLSSNFPLVRFRMLQTFVFWKPQRRHTGLVSEMSLDRGSKYLFYERCSPHLANFNFNLKR